jgi:Tol biopolymer transport system component
VNDRLESWKEIAAYLKRDIRTVQRWEKREGLPVHRHLHEKLGTVYAFPVELDQWWANRQPVPQPRRRRRVEWAVAAGVLVAGALAAGWWYRAGREPAELVVRRVWAGPDADRFGSVSPDGRYLSYVDPGSGEVFLYELSGGATRRLTVKDAPDAGTALDPVFSPDAREIAYARRRPDCHELRLVAVDRSRDRSLYRSPDTPLVQPEAWTPDGKQVLALVRNREGVCGLGRFSLAAGTMETARQWGLRYPLGLTVSPDGRWAAYDLPAGPGRDLFVMDLATRAETVLVDDPAHKTLLGWTPEGSAVVFASDRTGTTDVWSVEVSQGRARGQPRLVRRALGRAWPLGFTRAGTYYYGLQTGTMDVYLADLDTRGLVRGPGRSATRQGLGSNRAPDWSPDGARLAFVWSPASVVVRRPDAGEHRELRVNLLHIEMLSWSPEGRSLLLSGADLHLRSGVFELHPETGALRTLLQSPEPGAVYSDALRPPGSTILYYKFLKWGNLPAPLFAGDRLLLPSVYRFSLSPDGRQLAYSTFDDHSEFIRLLPARGGPEKEVYRQPRGARIRSLAWLPGGQALLFARRGELWRLPLDGGAPEKAGLAAEDLRDLRVSPDGRRLAYTAGVGKGEVWVMENLR